jgi:putative tryptophan/tyrosine transport system substrate-binding protein
VSSSKSFVVGSAAALLLATGLRAQPAGQPARIGFLAFVTEPVPGFLRRIELLRAALHDLGWVEGRNLVIEVRFAGPDPHRQRERAAELKAVPVALILAEGTTSIRAARDGAPGLPVVMVNAGDPVGSGLVANLSRPGGDLTGTSAAGEEVLGKQVELLSAAVPQLKRMGVLMNSANPSNSFFFAAMLARAQKLGLPLERIEIGMPDGLDAAIAHARGGALVVLNDPMFGQNNARVRELTLRHQVPAMFGDRAWAVGGGLMSYVSSIDWHWRKAASFIDRILKGAKPAELPVEQPTQFELVINLKTAKALGLAIPQSLLQRADEVIE